LPESSAGSLPSTLSGPILSGVVSEEGKHSSLKFSRPKPAGL